MVPLASHKFDENSPEYADLMAKQGVQKFALKLIGLMFKRIKDARQANFVNLARKPYKSIYKIETPKFGSSLYPDKTWDDLAKTIGELREEYHQRMLAENRGRGSAKRGGGRGYRGRGFPRQNQRHHPYNNQAQYGQAPPYNPANAGYVNNQGQGEQAPFLAQGAAPQGGASRGRAARRPYHRGKARYARRN